MIYEPTRPKPLLSDCAFYYSQTFPSGTVVKGEWDLADNVAKYTGGLDWTGSRVLDVGTASGTLTFDLERRGAEVVSLDVANGGVWELIPFAGATYDLPVWAASVERLKNSYWFGYHEFESKARALYCDIYHPPVAMGEFTHAVFGSVLLHLSNPFLALTKIARHVTKTIVVTDMHRQLTPGMEFAPALSDRGNACAWWFIPHPQVERMLRVLGFKTVKLDVFYVRSVRFNQLSPFYCLVAERE